MVNAQQCCPLSASTCDAGEQYLMNPSTAENIQRFSPCSIGNICAALGTNSVKSTCLTNNRGVTTISGQTCGNGIVEGDEQCDCGGTEGCGTNSCCNPETCKFVDNAVCDDSNEDCCKDCQFAAASTVCRTSSGSCDPEEKCTGTSPYCPEDKTQPDGQDCGNGLKCASGQCTSRDNQCKTVMGSYTQGNDTYACDNSNCMMSCASPEFPRNTCYGLQQNFLDGTPCTGGGTCSNVSSKSSHTPLDSLLTSSRANALALPSARKSQAGSTNTNPWSSALRPRLAASSSSASSAVAGAATNAGRTVKFTLTMSLRIAHLRHLSRLRGIVRVVLGVEGGEEQAEHQCLHHRP
jgi:hypothetical protein